jgi:hypothetical protein
VDIQKKMEEKGRLIQENFLKRVKASMPLNMSLVEELAELFGISNDSAYRRLRCETPLNIHEVSLLCEKYNLSLDADIKPLSGKVSFDYSILTNNEESFAGYLRTMVASLKRISSSPEKNIIYAADDVPIFHHFVSEDLTRFNIFYWLNSFLNVPAFD